MPGAQPHLCGGDCGEGRRGGSPGAGRAGVGRELVEGGDACVTRLKMPPILPGRRSWCRLGMKRDEKFCMAGCGEKQRQSGWFVLRKKCIAVLVVPPSQGKLYMQLESLD